VNLRVKRLHPDAKLPCYGRPSDAGLDLHAFEDTVLAPNEQQVIKTGIAVAVPEGTVGLVWDRSGMAAKNGIKTMAGVIDCTYRGELVVVLINLRSTPYGIRKGDRVAQLLVQPIITIDVEETTELDETPRGTNKFSSSGR